MKISKLKDVIYELVNVAEYEFTPTYFKNIDNACVEICEKLDKLADYEDKEEQGLLIELPCNVGTTVFCIFERRTKCTEHNQEFDEYSCQGCECLECDSRKEKYVHEMKAYSLDWIITNIDNFGKTIFLTRSEAEEALAKMGGKQ